MFCQRSSLKTGFKSLIRVSIFTYTRRQISGEKSVAFIYLCYRSIPALLPRLPPQQRQGCFEDLDAPVSRVSD